LRLLSQTVFLSEWSRIGGFDVFRENKSSDKGESAVNEPQPLISQQGMLTDQG